MKTAKILPGTIDQLKSLKDNSKSFIDDKDCDDNQIWKDDIIALDNAIEIIQAYSSSGLNELAKEIHENAKAHGWHETPKTFGEIIALIHSEASEALEEYRIGKGHSETYYGKNNKPEGIPSEMADIIIRVLEYCATYGIDIEAAIHEKHEYNKTRPYKHGGKKI